MLTFNYDNELGKDTNLNSIEEVMRDFDKFIKSSYMSGWINIDDSYINLCNEINEFVDELKKENRYMIVIGIGGSYLGAASAIELMSEENNVFFIGPYLDKDYLEKIIHICKTENVVIDVISKSGNTMETRLFFDILKPILKDKYGKKYINHIICTTGNTGELYKESIKNNYKIFNIPDNIGGRYSVFTTVGLLPMAFAGVDIKSLIYGVLEFNNQQEAFQYAIIRNNYFKNNKNIEIFIGYEKKFELFNEWLKQLFGESEGKNNKGIFPASVIFPKDLHSLGQYIQEGKRQIFETAIYVKNREKSNNLYVDNDKIDNLLEAIIKGPILAHRDGGTPVNEIIVDKLDAYNLGQLYYFFGLSCAISAHIMGVDPFNQPGVERYKSKIREILSK